MEGAVGWVIEIDPKWASLLKQAERCLLNSSSFPALMKYCYGIFAKRHTTENPYFVDGDIFVFLLKLDMSLVGPALRGMRYTDGSDGLPTCMEEFLEELHKISQLCIMFSPVSYYRNQ